MPPSACSKRPARRATAPVKAPFSWPKNSDSMSSRGTAVQLTATKGRSRRGERRWTARAEGPKQADAYLTHFETAVRPELERTRGFLGATVERILAAPRTGAWHLSDGGKLTFQHVSNDWHDITTEDEAFFMRVYGPGEYRFHGADLGILVTKGRMQTAEGLTDRCRHYIEGIRAHYQSEPLPQPPAVKPVAYVK